MFAAASIGNATMPADPAYASRWLPVYLLMGLGVALTLPQLSSAAVQGLPPAGSPPAPAPTRRSATSAPRSAWRAVVVILAGAAPGRACSARSTRRRSLTAVAGLLVAGIATTLPRRARTRTVAVPEPA